MGNCKNCGDKCERREGKRSARFYCSYRCYLMIRVNKTESCWLCMTAIRKDGYSSLKVDDKEMLAHRLSYITFIGPIPNGKLVCHKCDVRNCVNPEHLYIGDDKTNAIDRQFRNKSCCQQGEKNHRSKLKENEILEIRKLLMSPMTLVEIGRQFNVTASHILNIKKNKMWTNLKE